VAKLNEAERAKEEMESELKRKEQEMQKRTGARFQGAGRPAAAGCQDAIQMGVSHRGPGAFPRAEMMRPPRKVDGTTSSKCPASDDPVTTAQRQNLLSDKSTDGPRQVDVVESGPSAVAGGLGTVDAGCSACPTNVSTAPTDDVSRVDRQPAADDDGQTDEQRTVTRDECKAPADNDDTQQQQQQPASETDANDTLLTAST